MRRVLVLEAGQIFTGGGGGGVYRVVVSVVEKPDCKTSSVTLVAR